MTITKKDTIVLAVLFNIVVLAGVLATAHQLSSKPDLPQREPSLQTTHQCFETRESDSSRVVLEEGAVAFDEIDQLLEEYIPEEVPSPPATSPSTKETKKPSVKEGKSVKAKETISSDAYYTVKAGDNPWKIAKKFHISFEKLLQLNHLDEAKARNLKIGQKLKIKET